VLQKSEKNVGSVTSHVLVQLRQPLQTCRFERKEAHTELDQPFDEAMVLVNEVIEVFARLLHTLGEKG
jgi:hypothetical protein